MQFPSMLPRSNLASDAAAALASSIRAEALAPGARLPSEAEIARQLGVSRPVVREAVAFLKADGIVESRRGLGLFVGKPDTLRLRVAEIEASAPTILEFLEFRLGLEVESAQLAAVRRTAEDMATIDAAFTRLAAADEAGVESAEEDLAFHLAIVEAAHNALYRRVLHFVSGPLLGSIRQMRARDGDRSDPVALRRRDHALIRDRIAARDQAGAGAAMRAHIGESYRRYAEQAASTDTQPSSLPSPSRFSAS